MKISPRPVVVLTLLSALLLSGCAVHDDFVKADAAGTFEAWDGFVKKYPVEKNPACDDCRNARKIYDALLSAQKEEWERAQSVGTASAYSDFLTAHAAESPYYAPAREALRGLLLKGQAEEADYTKFLARFRDDAGLSDVRRALAGLRFQAAKASDDAGAMAFFLAEYPATPEAAKLKPLLERAEFEKAKRMRTRLALDFFLKRYPDSAKGEDARAILSGLPHDEPVADDGGALELLPRLRAASRDLAAQECLGVLAAAVKAENDPYGAGAEGLRAEFSTGGALPSLCASQRMGVPPASRPLVGGAVRALAELSQRQERFGGMFAGASVTSAKAKEIGRTSYELADRAEAFDLEMQAYYGYMPADPDKPHEKAAANAKEAERRARHAMEASQSEAVAANQKAAADVLRLMDDQKELLVKIIAYHEKPEKEAP